MPYRNTPYIADKALQTPALWSEHTLSTCHFENTRRAHVPFACLDIKKTFTPPVWLTCLHVQNVRFVRLKTHVLDAHFYYDKRTSKTRVFGDSKARVKNARFYSKSHVEDARFDTQKCAFLTRVFRNPKAHAKNARFYGKSGVKGARFAVRSHAFDVSVCNQTPEQAFMTTLACHIHVSSPLSRPSE